MKKITLTGGRYFVIADEKYEPLKAALNDQNIISIDSVDGTEYTFSPRAFVMAEPAIGQEFADLIPKERRLESRATLSDEERAANLEKVEKIKAKIRADLAKRKAERNK